MPVEKAGDISPLLESARLIGVADDQPEEQRRTPGGYTPKPDSDRPAGYEELQIDPNSGTFERFLGSFGAPHRWAGT